MHLDYMCIPVLLRNDHHINAFVNVFATITIHHRTSAWPFNSTQVRVESICLTVLLRIKLRRGTEDISQKCTVTELRSLHRRFLEISKKITLFYKIMWYINIHTLKIVVNIKRKINNLKICYLTVHEENKIFLLAPFQVWIIIHITI